MLKRDLSGLTDRRTRQDACARWQSAIVSADTNAGAVSPASTARKLLSVLLRTSTT
jgi:hypothetical protein